MPSAKKGHPTSTNENFIHQEEFTDPRIRLLDIFIQALNTSLEFVVFLVGFILKY